MGDAPSTPSGAAHCRRGRTRDGQPARSGGFLVTVAVKPADAAILIHGINNRTLYAALRGSDVKIDPASRSTTSASETR